MNTDNISKSQLEVWDWKQKSYEELQNIPRDKWMSYIKAKTQPFIDEIIRKKRNLKEPKNQ